MSHGRGSARERGIDASVLMDKEGEADLCCGRREREGWEGIEFQVVRGYNLRGVAEFLLRSVGYRGCLMVFRCCSM